jgi:peptide/nickel transport system permease protein
MEMRTYILRRAATAFAVFLIILTINFIIFHTIPGDPIRTLFQDPRISPEDLAQLRHSFGLDKPLWEQYVIYMKNSLTGDMGRSFSYYGDPVGNIVKVRLVNTLILVGSASVLALIMGVAIGTVAAWKRNTKTDFSLLGSSLFLYSMPTFWLGMLLLFALSGLVPSGGMYTPGADYAGLFDQFLDLMRHLVVPMTVLTLVLFGQYVMIMRSSLIDVLSEDFIVTASAKGLTGKEILRHHAVPNAMLPLVTITAINLSFVVGGAIQTETVFSWPGIGRLMYDALITRDYPILQGSFLVVTAVALLANLIADVTYAFLDPRVKIR